MSESPIDKQMPLNRYTPKKNNEVLSEQEIAVLNVFTSSSDQSYSHTEILNLLEKHKHGLATTLQKLINGKKIMCVESHNGQKPNHVYCLFTENESTIRSIIQADKKKRLKKLRENQKERKLEFKKLIFGLIPIDQANPIGINQIFIDVDKVTGLSRKLTTEILDELEKKGPKTNQGRWHILKKIEQGLEYYYKVFVKNELET